MRIVNLASGSKGNSTFVECKNTKILIDAGISVKKLEARLNEIGESISGINAVLITHEHVDHISAIEQLLKKFNIKIFVHQELKNSEIFSKYAKFSNISDFICEKFEFMDLEVLPFEVSHDSVRPVGFVLSAKGSKAKVGFVTDLGIVTDSVTNALLGVKMVFIESNHDEDMIKSGSYPASVKKRIVGKFGHLSNKQSIELAKALYDSGTRCFVLSHLSEENNTQELAYSNYINYFESKGLKNDKDLFVRISFQNKHGNNFNLKEEY